jgi:hypothetical protein
MLMSLQNAGKLDSDLKALPCLLRVAVIFIIMLLLVLFSDIRLSLLHGLLFSIIFS